jgi:uncharacterized protein YfiM (DUF2279 family)
VKSWYKILILICILFSLNTTAQQPPWEGKFIAEDKAMHFTFSAAFTMLATETAKDYKAKNPELIGIIAGFGIGLSKEFLYDKNQSSRDLLVDFAGCTTGLIVNRWINKRIEKAYKKKGW